MQHDQIFDQVDYHDASQQQQQQQHQQQHDLSMMMTHPGDMFGYPMSAPVNPPANFWDPSVTMCMDMDFSAAGVDGFQQAVLAQDPSVSFDWSSSMDLFQDPSLVPPPSSNQENIQPSRHAQPIAPKPPVAEQTSAGGSTSMAGTYTNSSLDDPFGLVSHGNAVDPGLLFGRPQTSAVDSAFNVTSGSGHAVASSAAEDPTGGSGRRKSAVKEPRNGKMPDRAYASSPIKSSVRPGLGRSLSENRGKKPRARGPLPVLAPATRPTPPVSGGGSGVEAARPGARTSGRVSPLKKQHRLSGLASIPELSSQPHSRTSVRFTIDSNGRARAETTMLGGAEVDGGIPRSQSSRELGRDDWEESEYSSSSDDEPIIIPSRNNSFSASFALPDPRKPVGSIFHSSKRSLSDRSTSTTTTMERQGAGANEGESEAETVMEEGHGKGGDAASELRKVVENRQKRTSQMGSGRSQRFLPGSRRSFDGSLISPTTMTDPSYGGDGQGVRCVCNRNEVDEAPGFMVQWYGTTPIRSSSVSRCRLVEPG